MKTFKEHFNNKLQRGDAVEIIPTRPELMKTNPYWEGVYYYLGQDDKAYYVSDYEPYWGQGIRNGYLYNKHSFNLKKVNKPSKK